MDDVLTGSTDLFFVLKKRCLSLTEANNCVDLTIRIFDSMAENHDLKFKEVKMHASMNKLYLKM